MLKKLKFFLLNAQDRQRIIIALTKGAAMRDARKIDLRNPETWEFSGFSQNGEDGIFDVLSHQLLTRNRYFFEVGASDGIDNNSGWMVIAEKYAGLMIEGDPNLVDHASRIVAGYSTGVECKSMFLTRDNAKDLMPLLVYKNPDVFTLDIDGNDYYIVKSLFESGLRPKICAVEYNSAYGPSKSMTIEYDDRFVFTKAHPTGLYYGVSVSGWRKFFESYGYRFVTVDRNGVNAFFIDPSCFNASFVNEIKGLEYAENKSQFWKFRKTNEEQFKLIADQKFVEI